MKRIILLIGLFIAALEGYSQELYVFSEPASNMPAKSLGLKLTGRFPMSGRLKQRYMPELMVAVNKHLMMHISSTFSNIYSANTKFEGGKVYAKYRFLSVDDVHSHFRMAAFADVAFTKNPYTYHEINLEGDNDGAQVGLIATQLVNKFAVSGTVGYTRVFNQPVSHTHSHDIPGYNALNYSLSAGLLVLPKEYVDYSQTNLNIYLELLGMKSLDQKHYSVDLAPAFQLIFNSNTKVNLGYRFQVAGNMARIANQTWQVGLEHTLFNLWK